MRLRSWKPTVKGALRGFATLETRAMTLHDCPVHVTYGRPWVGLPGKPIIDAEGRHAVGPNGKKRYGVVIEWRDKDIGDRFSAAALATLRAAGITLDGEKP
jgi:hypothetical protein